MNDIFLWLSGAFVRVGRYTSSYSFFETFHNSRNIISAAEQCVQLSPSAAPEALGLSFACLTKYILIKKLCAFLAVFFSFFSVAASCRQPKVSQRGRRRPGQATTPNPPWFCFRWRRHCGVFGASLLLPGPVRFGRHCI